MFNYFERMRCNWRVAKGESKRGGQHQDPGDETAAVEVHANRNDPFKIHACLLKICTLR